MQSVAEKSDRSKAGWPVTVTKRAEEEVCKTIIAIPGRDCTVNCLIVLTCGKLVLGCCVMGHCEKGMGTMFVSTVAKMSYGY